MSRVMDNIWDLPLVRNRMNCEFFFIVIISQLFLLKTVVVYDYSKMIFTENCRRIHLWILRQLKNRRVNIP